ncbi:MAG TPA: iron-containing alcohol dehydrogenase [Clostridia bacterium]|nr:iron-containing alcohol dehydrogenase [Clostridia bacterium]
MNMAFDLSSSARTIMGDGSSKKLSPLLLEYGKQRIVVLMDAGIKKSGIGDGITTNLQTAGIQAKTIADLPREPGVPDVDKVIGEVKEFNPDAVIAVGGGSVLDIGKLCSVLVQSDVSVLELLDGAEIPEHATFTVLIPTTAGTGSEATKNAIISIPSRNTKGAVVHERLLPDLVLLDPALTTSLPEGITTTTGMDALCHAMECYFSKKANAMSDLLALDAIKRIARSIRKTIGDGQDIEARSDMMLAAYYAGMCITLSGTNAVHALSYPLGTRYHIPHGQSNAMLLPYVMEQNLAAMPEKSLYAAKCFGYDPQKKDWRPADYLVKELHSLLDDLDINTSLKAFGVKIEDTEMLVESAHQNRRLMDNNPVDLTKAQIGAIYSRLMGEK